MGLVSLLVLFLVVAICVYIAVRIIDETLPGTPNMIAKIAVFVIAAVVVLQRLGIPLGF